MLDLRRHRPLLHWSSLLRMLRIRHLPHRRNLASALGPLRTHLPHPSPWRRRAPPRHHTSHRISRPHKAPFRLHTIRRQTLLLPPFIALRTHQLLALHGIQNQNPLDMLPHSLDLPPRKAPQQTRPLSLHRENRRRPILIMPKHTKHDRELARRVTNAGFYAYKRLQNDWPKLVAKIWFRGYMDAIKMTLEISPHVRRARKVESIMRLCDRLKQPGRFVRRRSRKVYVPYKTSPTSQSGHPGQ
jgi:hypothetical protein